MTPPASEPAGLQPPRPFFGRARVAAAAFTLAYMLAAAVFAARTGNAEFRF